jgi:hypothetical protein
MIQCLSMPRASMALGLFNRHPPGIAINFGNWVTICQAQPFFLHEG